MRALPPDLLPTRPRSGPNLPTIPRTSTLPRQHNHDRRIEQVFAHDHPELAQPGGHAGRYRGDSHSLQRSARLP
ncbi:MAG TPA: hypothetical protein QGG37_01750 [Chloroflexota bacterium]|nr:hypothetical protein [Chloroflexota bacterium]